MVFVAAVDLMGFVVVVVVDFNEFVVAAVDFNGVVVAAVDFNGVVAAAVDFNGFCCCCCCCLLYTSPSPRDRHASRMPSSA